VQTFAKTDEQALLAENVSRLMREANDFESRRRRLGAANPDRLALWPALADLGVLAAAFDEIHGGFAGDARTMAVIMSELGTALAVEPYLSNAIVAGRIFQHCSDKTAGQKAIDAIVGGQQLYVLAHNPANGPFAAPGVSASIDGNTVTLSGVVSTVRHAELAHQFLVPVVTAANSINLYVVSRGQLGLGLEGYRLIDAAGAADLSFSDVKIASSAHLQLDAPARDVIDEAADWGILGLAAEVAGIVTTLNQITFAYLMTRKQFGAALGNFQALQHRAADMWIAAQELVAVVELAVETFANAPSSTRAALASAVKVVADRAGRRVGNDAVQLHGGMGVSDELIVSHYFRRLAAARSELGTEDTHRLRFRSTQ
jgi:alkylation response protein AidB-like acyl-CoA dehydrogenase